MPAARPTCAIVVPFHGGAEEAAAAIAAMERIDLRDDEIVLVDNTAEGVALGLGTERVRVVAAPEQQSSYHARNVGILATDAAWVLLMDADCRPAPDVLDRYFGDPVPADCGAIAGAVLALHDDNSLVAAYSRSRDILDQEGHRNHPFLPFANTSNLLVRRATWEALGGFHEGIRSGGDVDFCWRLQQAGWQLVFRPEARVHHVHRDTVRGLARQMARYGAGQPWLCRRHPGSFAPHRAPRIVTRQLAGAVVAALRGDGEEARFRVLDAVHHGSLAYGYRFGSNLAGPSALRSPEGVRPAATPRLNVAILASRFPELSETFIVGEARALQEQGHMVRVEARGRGQHLSLGGTHGLRVAWAEDDSRVDKVRAFAWFVARHPARWLRDLRLARSLRRAEPVPRSWTLAPVARRLSEAGVEHLHVHFADEIAADAMRLAAMIGRPYSLTAHAYDIYQQPRNLERKLADAAFVTSGCEYTVKDLRKIVGPARAADVHEIVMGVDADRFQRRTPPAERRSVLAVGRLVEKKGFHHLIEALARPDAALVDELLIVGTGPLMEDLVQQAGTLSLNGRVQFLGPRPPEAVRDLLEQAAVLVMPCVVAADGDRDSMPVVVKEALAMEVPVVASDEVGLPELVEPAWGRLVPPGDPAALAGALREVLEMSVAERAEMGRRGREHVRRACDVRTETAKLARLIAAAVGRGGPDLDGG